MTLLNIVLYAAVRCGSPPAVANAEVTVESEEFFVGDTATYRCASQYQFDQQSANGSLVVLQADGTVASVCAAKGEWHIVPRCKGEGAWHIVPRQSGHALFNFSSIVDIVHHS